MIEVRKNVFETNSSSTHALCIARNPKTLKISPCKSLWFGLGEYGWKFNRLLSIEEKASYLYMMAVETDYDLDQFKQEVSDILGSIGIRAEFDEIRYQDGYIEYGYIDHGYEWTKDLSVVMAKQNLINFLFNDQSFVITGNDNQEGFDDFLKDMTNEINGEYEVFEKWN